MLGAFRQRRWSAGRGQYDPNTFHCKGILDELKEEISDGALFSTFVLGLLLLAVAAPCRAQAIASPNGEYLIGADTAGTAAVPNSAAAGAASAADAAAGDPSSATDVAAAAASATASAAQVGLPAPDTGWHFSVAPYLWTPWIYGTIGVNGNNADYYVGPSQLFTHFRFGLLGLVDTRYKRIVLPVDILWLRLGDDRAFPRIPNETFANIKFDLFMLTPKVGYRVINMTAIKVDALAGFRYFHFGENLSFNPPHPNPNFSGSQNWVDPLVGGRIMALSPPRPKSRLPAMSAAGVSVHNRTSRSEAFSVTGSNRPSHCRPAIAIWMSIM